MNIKNLKILSIASILGLVVLIVIYPRFLRNSQQSLIANPPSSQVTQNDKPQIVSTKPDPLNEAVIPADQVIEITFNRSLQNAPEFKVKIEPKIDFKVELSGDRKTAKIIPVKPYGLGAVYTLYIGPDTKFDGIGQWGEDKRFQFRTIKYRGI